MIGESQPLRVFIGLDHRERRAFKVCERSMRAACTKALHVEPLDRVELTRAGLYGRRFDVDEDNNRTDIGDGRPLSTDFSFTRFLVPALCQWRGVALFCDSDFMWRADVAALFALADPQFAVQVVKHDFEPTAEYKMRGQVQERYRRKNWSSLMLFNCQHEANKALTPRVVSQRTGRWLHGFEWLRHGEIGELASGWNVLEGVDDHHAPLALHYTRGTPDMEGYSDTRLADEWRAW
jgi:hypothetical protein